MGGRAMSKRKCPTRPIDAAKRHRCDDPTAPLRPGEEQATAAAEAPDERTVVAALSETLGGVWGSPSRRYYKILGGPPNNPV